MPALKSLPEKFSLQGCEASEGVFLPRKRRKARGDDAFGSELFSFRPASRTGVARRDVGSEAGRLSLGHNDTAPKLSSKNDAFPLSIPTPKMARVYPGAALGEVPGIPNHGPSFCHARPTSKRGKILSFSESSRRNLQTLLAKIKTSAALWTMCLSLPGYCAHFGHHSVKVAFLRFCKMFTAMVARDGRFAEVGALWKQELQQRNMLHFHLIFSGITDNNRDFVWSWCVDNWVRCVMDIPGMPPAILASEVSKMRGVHLFEGTKHKGYRDSNFQKIRGNFHSYFAKYLGKDVEARCAETPIPGRWWGQLNSALVPYAPKRELLVPDRVAVHAQRVARKIRQARADNAKHASLCRRFGGLEIDGVTPGVSRQQLQLFYREWIKFGGDPALDDPVALSRLRFVCGSGMGYAMVMFHNAIAQSVPLKSLLAGFRFPRAMKFSGVRLIGAHVPEMVVRVLFYAGGRALVDRDISPF